MNNSSFDRRGFIAASASGLAATLVRAVDPAVGSSSEGKNPHWLDSAHFLEAGEVRTSPNGRFTLRLQTDGNLVWLDRQRVLWHTNTAGTKSARCFMQADGNLVIHGKRDAEAMAVWASESSGHEGGGARLACQSDGNLVVYLGNSALFATNTEMARIAATTPQIKVRENWGADHLYNYLNALPGEGLLAIMKSLELRDKNDGLEKLNGRSQDVPAIQKKATTVSSNIITGPFKDSAKFNYHDLVKWVAGEAGVEPAFIAVANTFAIEREIQRQLFAKLWDKMTPDQRAELLAKLDPNKSLKDHAACALLGGLVALGTLSTTVLFTGFAFYTTMSITISAAAGFFSVGLPFAVYAAASSIVAFLCGPTGWAVMAVALAAAVALAGSADVKKSTAFICQIHALKLAAFMAAETPEKEVFLQ